METLIRLDALHKARLYYTIAIARTRWYALFGTFLGILTL